LVTSVVEPIRGAFASQAVMGAGEEQPKVSVGMDEVDALDIDDLAVDLLNDLHRDCARRPSRRAADGRPAPSS
jgi:hypothetical protein